MPDATSVRFHLPPPLSVVVENGGGACRDNNNNKDDDRETVVALDDGSDAGTCSTQTALLSEDEYEGDAHGTEEDPLDGKDDAAHHVEGMRGGSNDQTSRYISDVLRKDAQLTTLPQGVILKPSDTPFYAEVMEGEGHAVKFPQLAISWEVVESGQVLGRVQQYMIPSEEKGKWGFRGESSPPAKLTCVYEAGRHDIPERLRGDNLQALCDVVSRVHCRVRVHFRLVQAAVTQKENSTVTRASFYSCNSFDVVDHFSSNGTFYHGVRLLPSHRYSFSTKDCFQSFELMLGEHYRLRIQMNDAVSLPSEDAPIQQDQEKEEEQQQQQKNQRATNRVVERTDAEVQWTSCPLEMPRRLPLSRKRQATAKPAAAHSKSKTTRRPKEQVSKKERIADPFIEPRLSGMQEEANGTLTIVTTGLRIGSAKEAKLRQLNIVVNPSMTVFSRASILVIEGPLMRSVKLLTALPYVHHIVNSAWLKAVLALLSKSSSSSTLSSHMVDPGKFLYMEQRSRRSIEAVNEFSLKELMQVPPPQRQSLFSGQIFWVHPQAEPQDPPDNDLNFVIIASGGALTKDCATATVAVMPNLNVTSSMWRSALLCPAEPECIFIVPNDLFRAVLQQRRLTTSTVRAPVGVSVLPPNQPSAKTRGKRRPPSPTRRERATKTRCY